MYETRVATDTDDRSKGTMMEPVMVIKRSTASVLLALGLVLHVSSAAAADFPRIPVRRCGPDAVVAGTVCLDRYEASVWRVPNPTTTNAGLVRKIQLGRVTQADLAAGEATPVGAALRYAPCGQDGPELAHG